MEPRPEDIKREWAKSPVNPYADITGVMCRKKGMVSVSFCTMCPEFEPACVIKQNDPLEGKDGIDPHTGNSYATCKWFGKIIRTIPNFSPRKVAPFAPPRMPGGFYD